MPHVLTCPLARQQQKATDSLFDRCVGIDGVCASRRNLLPLVRLAILSPSLHAGTLQSSRMVAFYKQHEPFEPKHLLWPLSPQSFSGLREKVRISAHEGKRASSSGGMRTHMSPIGRELKFFHPPWMPSTCGSGKVSPAEITHHTHTHTHTHTHIRLGRIAGNSRLKGATREILTAHAQHLNHALRIPWQVHGCYLETGRISS